MARRIEWTFIVATVATVAVGEMKTADDPAIASESFAGNWKDEDSPRSPLEKPGWTLTFGDDFDGVHLKDRNWFQSYRAGRKDWFRRMGIASRFDDPDANYVIEDGILKLRIDRDVPLRAEPKAAAVSSIQTSDYRVGKTTNDIQRLDKFAQKYGWWEIRCRMPKGDGLHAAFWLTHADPLCQEYTLDNERRGFLYPQGARGKDSTVEIDIFEALGRYEKRLDLTVLFPNNRHSEGHFFNHDELPFDWSRHFHTYALEWEEGQLTWYIDGQKYWRYRGPTPQKEMMILLGMYQLGANPKFAGWLKPTPDNLPYPLDFEIDYVRVYARSEGGCPSGVSARTSGGTPAPTVAEYHPERWNLEARKRFAEQRFGIFIHWGLYANYAQGEWYQQQIGMDTATYGRAMDEFYPSKFDAKEWVRVFKGAGAKYVTITSRHHDGFSLWPTKVDDGFNIARTPFGRDILGELAAACREEGLQLNFYYSLMDWHRADYPAGDRAVRVLGRQKGDYRSYKRYMLDQIGELIENYRPGVIWFDGEWEHARNVDGTGWERTLDWEFDSIYDYIHARHVLVCNNNHQPIREKEDIQPFERDLPGENEDFGHSKYQPVVQDRPIEQCDVIQYNVWGYKIAERKFRTPEDVVAMLARAAANDANLLMNIGPDGSGRLPAKAVEVMAEVGKWMARNGESIYGTSAGGVGLLKDVVSTRRGDCLYLHFLNPKVNKFAFKPNGEIADVRCFGSGAEVSVDRTASGDAVVAIARPADSKFDIVVKMTVRVNSL